MDFSLTQEQEALRDLAREILEDKVTHESLKALGDDWFDRGVWRALAGASLLGLGLPEEHGGGGLGLMEICLLLEQVGRTVAPVPAWATILLGAAPIARFGSGEQHRRWLPGVAGGEIVLTAALAEPGDTDPLQPTTTARRDGAGWRLDGVKMCVPAAHLAARVLVPARAGTKTGVFLVDPAASGVTIERQLATTGEPEGRVTLAGAAGEPLGAPDDGARVLEWLLPRATVGLCALQLGVTDRALRMTADYTGQREQFGHPIASFQAVHQRAADAYVDVESIRLTTWQAAWRLDAGLPATAEVAVAKFFASEAAHRVVYAAQHLHGGIGVDVDYPLHRYYLRAKQIELTLGSGTRQLERLGDLLAVAPPDDAR